MTENSYPNIIKLLDKKFMKKHHIRTSQDYSNYLVDKLENHILDIKNLMSVNIDNPDNFQLIIMTSNYIDKIEELDKQVNNYISI